MEKRKLFNFNARYRTTVMNVMAELGLVHVGTPRQVENGTLMFRDPQAKCIYAFYESGYCRRLTMSYSNSQTINNSFYAMYQLNKTRKETVKYDYNGRTSEYNRTVRILANPMEQLGIVSAAIANFRLRYPNC